MGKAIKMFSGVNSRFTYCCEKSGVQATRRQNKKWQRQEGTAYKWHLENKDETTPAETESTPK